MDSVLGRGTILEQNCAGDIASTLPASDLSQLFLFENSVTENTRLILVMELAIFEPEALICSLLANRRQLEGAIWHFINRHVFVLFESFECLTSSIAHVRHFFETSLSFFCFGRLSQLLLNLLLSLFLDEPFSKCSEEGLLTWAQLADLFKGASVASFNRLGRTHFEVDTDQE